MGSLREIRKKLRSVENIKKITQAMEMVAGSRLRRAQMKAEAARPYASKMREILDILIVSSQELTHPLMKQREVKKIGFVVIGSDRGLCGSYNQNIISAAEKFLKQYPPEKVELILAGDKIINHFSAKKKWSIRQEIADWGGKISFPQEKALAESLMATFLSGTLNEIWLLYTRFENAVTRKIVVEKLLNIEIPESELENAKLGHIFEPTEQEIFTLLIPRFCITKLQQAFNESYASELAARIQSMRAATKNAEEMINKLTLERNKVRQTKITREIIEITSGAESLKN